MTMPEHLNQGVARLLKRPDEIRHTYLRRSHYVSDHVADSVLHHVETVLRNSEESRKGSDDVLDSLLVTCPPDHGKKTLVRRLKKSFPIRPNIFEERTEAPILFIDAYAHGKTEALYEDILSSVNPELVDSGGESQLKRQLLKTLKVTRTKVLVVSHAHRLFGIKGGDPFRVLPVLDWLTYHVGLTLVLVADPLVEEIISGDRYLPSRFRTVRMPPWTDRQEEFIGFLKGWEEILPLTEPSNLAKMNAKLLALCNGRTGELKRLLIAASHAAIDSPDIPERVTADLIDKVREQRLGGYLPPAGARL